MTKIVITGHTYGIGKSIYDSFKADSSNEVIGLSRSNGHDITKDFDKIVEVASGADLFINNAYFERQQAKLIYALKDKVSKMIVMGSVSRHYAGIFYTRYAKDKQELGEICRKIGLDPNGIPILHLDLTFIEGTPKDDKPESISSDFNISHTEIVDTILFWTKHPNIRQIEFRWKCTDYVMRELRRMNPKLDPTNITF